jgi:hypothetical protein
MRDRDDTVPSQEGWPQCDCGYQCQGETVQDRVRDAQRHAREAHGIDVSADQILKEGHPA